MDVATRGTMGDPLFWHRLQFGFTATYHYLFPQLTMGLAFIIVVLKALGLKTGEARYGEAARFWIRIFGINFAVGVVTGIPLEFQFGTNWARFSHLSGGIIGQTLGMEGMFAFFLESSFLGLLIWGEKKLSPRGHFGAALALWLGSWLSGYFIVATDEERADFKSETRKRIAALNRILAMVDPAASRRVQLALEIPGGAT